ncbi:MAG: zinc ribbon domain-containing protein [Promethearchaeota archaeon]
MKRADFNDLNLLDILKIVALSQLQATLITVQLNNLIFQDDFYLYAAFLTFLLFQLVFISPFGNLQIHLTDLGGLFRKLWPVLLEIILEFSFFWYFKRQINSAGYWSYSSGTFTNFHIYSLVFHFILLIPLYTFCLQQAKDPQSQSQSQSQLQPQPQPQSQSQSQPQLIDKKPMSRTFTRDIQHIIMILINVAAPFVIFFSISGSNWESQAVYFSLMMIPFILNLLVLKSFRSFSVVHPLNVIMHLVLYLSWQWIGIWLVGIFVTSFPDFVQVLGLLSFFGLMVLQIEFQQSLKKSYSLPIVDRLPPNYQHSSADRNLASQLSQSVPSSQLSQSTVYCPACSNPISPDIFHELTEDKSIFCAHCGEKIRYQEVFHLPKEKILSDHRKFLKKVHQSSSELNSQTNNHTATNTPTPTNTQTNISAPSNKNIKNNNNQ